MAARESVRPRKGKKSLNPLSAMGFTLKKSILIAKQWEKTSFEFEGIF